MRLAPFLVAAQAACATAPEPPYDYYGNPYGDLPYWSLYDDPFFWPYGGYFGYCYDCGGYYAYGYAPWYPHPGPGWHHPGFPHPGPGWGRPPLRGPSNPRPGGGFRPPARAMPHPHFVPHSRGR